MKIIENVHRLNAISQHEFARELGVAQPTVFYHIKKLRKVGILKGEQDNFYINSDRLAEIFSAEFGGGVVVVFLLFKLLLAKAGENSKNRGICTSVLPIFISTSKIRSGCWIFHYHPLYLC
ncbi:MAG: hypothetical protein DRJ43_01770 [Thermoprotei archaeon]|nr:MAG: hypothetical protein DRJ43_01770 [Thermoprotei archaeon]